MPETATCVHHWIIEPVSGSHSPGVCVKCGAEKMFANSFESGSDEFNPHMDLGGQRPEVQERRRVGQQKKRQKLAL